MSGIFDATIFDPVIFDTDAVQQRATPYPERVRKIGPHHFGYDAFAPQELERREDEEKPAVARPSPREDRAGKPLTPAEIDRLSGGPEARAAGAKADALRLELDAQQRIVAAAKARDEEIGRLLQLRLAAQREEQDIVFVMAALAAIK